MQEQDADAGVSWMRSRRFAIRLGTPFTLIGLLIAVASLVSASTPVSHSTVYSAPFSGTTSTWSQSYSNGCGANLLNVAPTLNLTTGIGQAWQRSTTSNCSAHSVGYQTITSESDNWFDLPTLSGIQIVRVAFAVHTHVSSELRVGTCAPTSATYWICAHFAGVEVYGNAYMIDESKNNGTGVRSHGFDYQTGLGNATTYSNGTYSVSALSLGNATKLSTTYAIERSFAFNLSYAPGDRYVLYMSFGFVTFAGCYAYSATWAGHCSGSATVNASTGKDSFLVKSISVS